MKHVFLHQDSIAMQAIQSTTYDPHYALKKSRGLFITRRCLAFPQTIAAKLAKWPKER